MNVLHSVSTLPGCTESLPLYLPHGSYDGVFLHIFVRWAGYADRSRIRYVDDCASRCLQADSVGFFFSFYFYGGNDMTGEEQVFESKKENIINNFINGTENDSALAYALYNDCYPFFDDSFKKYEQYFSIKSDRQQPFYEYIDTFSETNTYKTFNEVEADWKDKGISTMDIIIMLKYALLTERFTGEDFKNTLLRQGEYPIEASSIFKPFSPTDIVR